MENNTNEVTRAEFITPLNEPDMPAKVAAKIEKEDEYDLVSSLLAAAEYQQTPDMTKEVEIRRNGRLYFTVHVHPVSEDDISLARKRRQSIMRIRKERSSRESEGNWIPICSTPGSSTLLRRRKIARKSGATAPS